MTSLLFTLWGPLASAMTGAWGAEARRVFASFFVAPGNRWSHENVWVAEQEGRIVGALLGYAGRDAERLDGPLDESLRRRTGDPSAGLAREAAGDEFYLDSLIVAEECRGRGVATALIAAFEAAGAARGCSKFGLLVEPSNTAAYRLYDRLGYRSVGTFFLGGLAFDRLAKPSPTSAGGTGNMAGPVVGGGVAHPPPA